MSFLDVCCETKRSCSNNIYEDGIFTGQQVLLIICIEVDLRKSEPAIQQKKRLVAFHWVLIKNPEIFDENSIKSSKIL